MPTHRWAIVLKMHHAKVSLGGKPLPNDPHSPERPSAADPQGLSCIGTKAVGDQSGWWLRHNGVASDADHPSPEGFAATQSKHRCPDSGVLRRFGFFSSPGAAARASRRSRIASPSQKRQPGLPAMMAMRRGFTSRRNASDGNGGTQVGEIWSACLSTGRPADTERLQASFGQSSVRSMRCHLGGTVAFQSSASGHRGIANAQGAMPEASRFRLPLCGQGSANH